MLERVTGSRAARVWMLAALPLARIATAGTLLDRGYDEMYNLDFAAAHATLSEYMRQAPDDPMGPASDAAAYLFTEFDRLHVLQTEFFLHDETFRAAKKLTPDPTTARLFERQLARAQDLAARRLAVAPRDSNALLASMMAMGLRSDYDGLIDRRYISALSATRKSRLTAEKILEIDPKCYDAWTAIGVENYLLSQKPMPVRWFLRALGHPTDKAYGIEKLKLTAAHGHYLKPFAQLLLAVSALRAKDVDQARRLLQGLSVEYPRNHLYAEELARLK